ncbi:BREX system P-loop protein BrxC [Youngiibacter fragilis]|uniref:ATPase n=1 Tax=Youngiibacter fragilis 232.1 TaxID=994573 RepID=V7I554_9CLOT|nr:BREX system P-loop protein BrxC [Youngiibacter fragilis]ETA80431.1 ATPase [Youngiibacter fragilis 232.1]
MKIQNMLQKDINRDINGVIQVGQDDEHSLVQELSEYIITKELRRHFNTFFHNYSKAIDNPTDKIGVWISGFFGSGKSHFLKMLSYLLSNQSVAGRNAVDFFKDKFDDPMMYATVVRCTNIPTESILFNIDIEGPINKDKTAVMRVFATVFYNHLGFYGDDLKIAKLERFVDKSGKTDEFRRAFEQVNGESWVEARSSYAFFEDDIVSVLQSVLGMSETAARNWFNGEENGNMSIKLLVEEIKDYVDSKGKDFRLLFCVDEVGQYIGDDGDLMINLQSIVEELGSKCRGKVWVMVTSQEAIDSVVKISGDDFSKIQGRFNTRLSLSSASVDEVIKKRILEKTEDAQALLHMVYDKEHAVLKNLFTFNNAVLDIKGYANGGEFASTYPFVPYHFIIFQKVLAEIRKHGNSGKSLSGGERSMLSGFQEATQKVQNKDENAIVPFWQFYDTVHTFLESPIRRVIDRCQTAADKHDGLEQRDVSVLKLLYLVRYIDDFKANIDNISIMMVDDIRTDKIKLRREIAESLERLERQNYVARNGDTYSFLTDEEQDIAIDIRNTSVDSATIVQSIGQTIFSDIYPSKKYKYNKYDFAYDQYIDETLVGSASGGVRLRFVTVASDYYNAPEAKLLADSFANHEAIVLLSGDVHYFEELETAAKIRKYIKQKNVSQLPESIQDIIRKRQAQARILEDSAKKQIEKAIIGGAFFINGEKVDIKYGDAKIKLDEALKQIIESVYSKLNFVNKFFESDADILTILNSAPHQTVSVGTGANNEFALNEISQWLEDRHMNHVPVSMGDVQRRYQAIPYGWREVDIAALVARLIISQKVEIRYGGAVVGKEDKNLVRYMRLKSEIDKTSVSRRIAPSEDDMRKAVKFLRDWLGQLSIAEDEDGLVSFVKETLIEKLGHYDNLLIEYSHDHYPQKEAVENARTLISEILSQKNDNVALIKRLLAKQDDLKDATEDMEEIETFFKSQRGIFDSARKLQNDLQHERDYFVTDPTTNVNISELSSILVMVKPYGRIKDLSDLIQNIKKAYGVLLKQKKDEVLGIVQQCMSDVHTLAGVGSKATDEVKKSDDRFTEFKKKIADAKSLTMLDAMITQLLNYKDQVCKRIETILHDVPVTPGVKIAQVRRYDVFPVKRLTSREDVDAYLESIRKKLYDTLEANDGIQIN